MDLTKLQELIDEYISELDDLDDIEVVATEKRLAEVELETFLDWLKDQIYRLENV